MASTRASYRESCVSARIKTGEPQPLVCAWPRPNAFRRSVAEFMVQVHRISPELADYHVSQMDLAELRRRVKHYLALGVGVAVGSRAKRPKPGKILTRETVNQRIQPPRAIAVRSPSGGGGGGVDVPRTVKSWSSGRGLLLLKSSLDTSA
jgi:hypothetical protein